MMRTFTRVGALLLALIIAPGGTAFAQDETDHPIAPRGEYAASDLDTGSLSNPNATHAIVYSNVVGHRGAAWIRLHFSQAALPPGSKMRVSSLKDGEFQELDAAGMAMWQNTTAYFNGDQVLLELIAAPQSRGNRLAVSMLEVEVPRDGSTAGAAGQCGICVTDDRVASSQPWACRLMSVGCSATLFTSCSCLVTAGHCNSGTLVAQFNVPASLSNCATVNPPVADQFPILTGTLSSNAGVGNDWAVMRCGTNSLGQKPVQRYSAYRPLATTAIGPVLAVGSAITFNGYGVDVTCTVSQTQRLSTGAVTALLAASVQFNADVRGGNSGSSLLRNSEIAAIVTHCQTNCPNHGTRIDLAAFATARNTLCGACACPADVNYNGTVNTDDLLLLIGSWGACPADPTPCPADVTPAPFGNNSVDTDDLLLIIGGWGNCPL